MPILRWKVLTWKQRRRMTPRIAFAPLPTDIMRDPPSLPNARRAEVGKFRAGFFLKRSTPHPPGERTRGRGGYIDNLLPPDRSVHPLVLPEQVGAIQNNNNNNNEFGEVGKIQVRPTFKKGCEGRRSETAQLRYLTIGRRLTGVSCHLYPR